MTEILVVDDDMALGDTLGLLLRKQGYQVTRAADGHRAQQAIEVHPVDVVITDIVMPELDGLELIAWLRRTNSRARIIAMSGNARVPAGAYLPVAKHFGADRVLEKPFSLSELLAMLRDLGCAPTDAAAVVPAGPGGETAR